MSQKDLNLVESQSESQSIQCYISAELAPDRAETKFSLFKKTARCFCRCNIGERTVLAAIMRKYFMQTQKTKKSRNQNFASTSSVIRYVLLFSEQRVELQLMYFLSYCV